MCYDACCSNEQFNHQVCLLGLEDPTGKKVALARINFHIGGVLFLKSRDRVTSHQRGGPCKHFLPKQLVDKVLLFVHLAIL